MASLNTTKVRMRQVIIGPIIDLWVVRTSSIMTTTMTTLHMTPLHMMFWTIGLTLDLVQDTMSVK